MGVAPRDLFRIARLRLEMSCHCPFYLIVISGFQRVGSLNSSKIVQERGPLPGHASGKGEG